MDKKPSHIDDPALSEIVKRLANAYKPEQIILFGSKARGEDGRDSDYDLMLIVPDNAPQEQRGSKLAYETLWGTQGAADVLVWTRNAFESRLGVRTSLPTTIQSEGRILYEA